MTISANDSVLIAQALGVLYQIHPTPESIAEKSDDKIRSLICGLKAEGLPVETLECFQELFPGGLTVTREENLLPVVYVGETNTSATEVARSTEG